MKSWFLGASLASLSVCALAQAPASYTISTIAGSQSLGAGFAGDSGDPLAAQMSSPAGLALDGSGNLYIADSVNHVVRKVGGGTITTVAGTGTKSGYAGDSAAATSANLNTPASVALDSSGNIYIADTLNSVIRKVSGGNITTFAGSSSAAGSFSGDAAAATSAGLDQPAAVLVDASGNLYISDTQNHRIRKVTSDGNINTIVGTGTAGFSGDGGAALSAKINAPRGMWLDKAGNLYFADSENNRVRKVDVNGVITTVAGSASIAGFSGDGGLAVNARFARLLDVKGDANGNLYLIDSDNSRIRRVTAAGIVTTIAGYGVYNYWGDGGQATQAALNFPTALLVDGSGNVYFSDAQNQVIRLLTPASTSGFPAINGVAEASAFGGSTTIAPGAWIEIFGVSLSPSGTKVWGASDFKGLNAPTSLNGVTVNIGGQNAYVEFVSATQINAQVPAGVGPGQQYLSVTTPVGVSAPVTVNVNAVQPGFYAPQLNVKGAQYVGALLPDGKTFASTTQPAKPGQTVVVYGIGFGPVLPPTIAIAGQTVSQANTISTPIQIQIGGVTANLTYSGLAPGAIGLYQFNVVVPSLPANSSAPFTFTLGGIAGTQNLIIPIGN